MFTAFFINSIVIPERSEESAQLKRCSRRVRYWRECSNPANVESNKIVVHIKTGVNEVGGRSLYRIYPNPATNELTIEGTVGVRVVLLNMLGQQVYLGVLQSSKETINISHLPSGNYMLQLTGSNGSRNMMKLEKK